MAAWFREDYQPIAACRAISSSMWLWAQEVARTLLAEKAKESPILSSPGKLHAALFPPGSGEGTGSAAASIAEVREWIDASSREADRLMIPVDPNHQSTVDHPNSPKETGGGGGGGEEAAVVGKVEKKDTAALGRAPPAASSASASASASGASVPPPCPVLKSHLLQVVEYLGRPPDPQCPKCGKLASGLPRGISELRGHVRHCRGPLVNHTSSGHGEWSSKGPPVVDRLMHFRQLLGKVKLLTPMEVNNHHACRRERA